MTDKIVHLAIVPDGTRRWAKQNGVNYFDAYQRSCDVAYDTAKYCIQLGIKILTIWGFSTENWKRTKHEVGVLMFLFEKTIKDHLEELIQLEAKLHHIGWLDDLPDSLVDTIQSAEKQSKLNTKLTLNLAINYGGENELHRAKARLTRDYSSEIDLINPQTITDRRLRDYLDTTGQPNPNLIIRTGGQHRLSGFMPIQSAYSELRFIPTLWPDFTRDHLDKAIEWYYKQQQNLGE